MRVGLIKALAWIAALSKLPARDGHFTGEAAKDMSEADALRIAARYERRQFSAARGMGLAEIVHKSRHHRRAKQTHPGKRHKRMRP